MVTAACPINRSLDLESPEAANPLRRAVCEICGLFYSKGWLSALGGAVSIRDGHLVYMAPVGGRTEGRCPADIYFLEVDGLLREIQETDSPFAENRALMVLPYVYRRAGAVINIHSSQAAAVARLFGPAFVPRPSETQGLPMEFVAKVQRIPVIEDRGDGEALSRSFGDVLGTFPQSQAVLVQNHGIYLWGRDWRQVMTLAEHCHRLFDVALRGRQ